MNLTAPIISQEARTDIHKALTELTSRYIAPKTVKAIGALDDYIQNYGSKNSMFFGLMSVHIKMGFFDIFNPEARKFKADTANILYSLYYMILETRGVWLNVHEEHEIQKIAQSIVSNIYRISDKCESLRNFASNHNFSILTSLLADQATTNNPICDNLFKQCLVILVRDRLLSTDTKKYDFELFDSMQFIVLLRLENLFAISRLLKQSTSKIGADKTFAEEFLIALTKIYWPRILATANERMRDLTELGISHLLYSRDVTLLQHVWNNYVDDPDGDSPTIKMQAWIKAVLDEHTKQILEIQKFDYNNTKILTDIFLCINSIDGRNDNGLKDFLLETYYAHVNRLLENCVDLEQDLASLMRNFFRNLSIKSPALSDKFRDKTLNMLFAKFHRSHPYYKQEILEKLLKANHQFFNDLYKETTYMDEESTTLDFFNILLSNGTLKSTDYQPSTLALQRSYTHNALNYPAVNNPSMAQEIRQIMATYNNRKR